MKRALIIGGAALAAVIAVAVIVLVSSLDRIVKAVVEEAGSAITGTEVTLNEAEISPTSGEGALRGFRMGNPEGFKTESAVRLGEVRVTVDVGTIGEDPVVIKEVVIAAPEITYELGGQGSNIAAIRRNVAAYVGRSGPKPGASGGRTGGDGAGEGGAGEGGPRLVIKDLYIRGGRIGVSATVLGGKEMTVPLPDIHLKDIGKAEKGATPGEVAEKILAAIGDGATTAVGSLGIDKAMKAAKRGAAEAGKALEQGADEARKALERGVEDLGGRVEDLGGTVKDLGGAVKGLLGR